MPVMFTAPSNSISPASRNSQILTPESIENPPPIAQIINSHEICQINGHGKKRTPYFSEKRNNRLNLNCRVKSPNGDKIVCQHLALHWNDRFTATQGKVNYSQFDNTHSIHSDISTEAYHRIAPAIVRLARNAEWGRVIADTFINMDQCGDSTRALHVSSGNHAMTVGLKIKLRQEGKTWVIQFYDPNSTATHKRVAFSGAMADIQSEVTALRAEDFIEPNDLKLYWLEDEGLTAFFDHSTPVETMTLSHLPDDLLNPRVVYYAIRLELVDLIEATTNCLNASKEKVPSDKVERLLSIKYPNGMQGLKAILRMQNNPMLLAYSKLISHPQLPTEVMTKLLILKDEFGAPALFLALQNGETDTIRMYGEMFHHTHFPIETVAEVLSAKRADATPGLFMAIHQGRADAIRAYGEALLKARLPSEVVTELLIAKDAEDEPGLYSGVYRGHIEAVQAYHEVLTNSGVIDNIKQTLFATLENIRNPEDDPNGDCYASRKLFLKLFFDNSEQLASSNIGSAATLK